MLFRYTHRANVEGFEGGGDNLHGTGLWKSVILDKKRAVTAVTDLGGI